MSIQVKGPWVVDVGGRTIQSMDFEYDVQLTISGDFADDVEREAYAAALCARLNVEDHKCPCGCGRDVCGRCGMEQ